MSVRIVGRFIFQTAVSCGFAAAYYKFFGWSAAAVSRVRHEEFRKVEWRERKARREMQDAERKALDRVLPIEMELCRRNALNGTNEIELELEALGRAEDKLPVALLA